MPQTLIGGIGYRNLRDYSAGGAVVDRLSDRALPPQVRVEDISYNPIAFVQRLEDDTGLGRLIVVGTVARGTRSPGTLTAYRWTGALPDPGRIQAAVAEGVTGVISLDNTLIVGGHFAALPPDVVVVEIEPRDHEFGDEFSEPVAAAIDRACNLVLALATDPGLPAGLPEAGLGGAAPYPPHGEPRAEPAP